MNEFYVYIYLDPRKSGRYTYDDLGVSFLFEPFYVGKGKGNRYKEHLKLKDNYNLYKNNKIKAIMNLDMIPIIIKYKENILEEESLLLEKKIIYNIGRLNKETGCLTNLTDGGDGVSGKIYTEEERNKISERTKGEKNPMYGKGYLIAGDKNGFYGKVHTQEFKKERSLLSIKLWEDPIYREKTILAQRNKKMKESTKRLWSEQRKGKGNSKASRYFIKSPNDEIFIVEGRFDEWCIENNLSKRVLLKTIKTGIPSKWGKTKGWVVIKRERINKSN